MIFFSCFEKCLKFFNLLFHLKFYPLTWLNTIGVSVMILSVNFTIVDRHCLIPQSITQLKNFIELQISPLSFRSWGKKQQKSRKLKVTLLWLNQWHMRHLRRALKIVIFREISLNPNEVKIEHRGVQITRRFTRTSKLIDNSNNGVHKVQWMICSPRRW